MVYSLSEIPTQTAFIKVNKCMACLLQLFWDLVCSAVEACSGSLLLCFSVAVALLLIWSMWLTGARTFQVVYCGSAAGL